MWGRLPMEIAAGLQTLSPKQLRPTAPAQLGPTLRAAARGLRSLAGVPQVSGFSKHQLMSTDPASEGQVQRCRAAREDGGTGAPPVGTGLQGTGAALSIAAEPPRGSPHVPPQALKKRQNQSPSGWLCAPTSGTPPE